MRRCFNYAHAVSRFHTIYVSHRIVLQGDHKNTKKSLVLEAVKLFLEHFHVKPIYKCLVFNHFSVIDGFEWFWMGNLLKNIQLMLEFLKGFILGPALFLLYINDHPNDVTCNIAIFSYCTWMTFLTILSVILLSMLMILLSILSVIRHLICGNNSSWLWTISDPHNILRIEAGTGLLISL